MIRATIVQIHGVVLCVTHTHLAFRLCVIHTHIAICDDVWDRSDASRASMLPIQLQRVQVSVSVTLPYLTLAFSVQVLSTSRKVKTARALHTRLVLDRTEDTRESRVLSVGVAIDVRWHSQTPCSQGKLDLCVRLERFPCGRRARRVSYVSRTCHASAYRGLVRSRTRRDTPVETLRR